MLGGLARNLARDFMNTETQGYAQCVREKVKQSTRARVRLYQDKSCKTFGQLMLIATTRRCCSCVSVNGAWIATHNNSYSDATAECSGTTIRSVSIRL
jgi:hypothetical protein